LINSTADNSVRYSLWCSTGCLVANTNWYTPAAVDGDLVESTKRCALDTGKGGVMESSNCHTPVADYRLRMAGIVHSHSRTPIRSD